MSRCTLSRSGFVLILVAVPLITFAEVPYDCSDAYETGGIVEDAVAAEEWTPKKITEATQKYYEWYYSTTTTRLVHQAVAVAHEHSEVKYAPSKYQSAVLIGGSPYWMNQKTKWCCEVHGAGCTTTTTKPWVYKCKEGLENYVVGWSSSKKTWCCTYEGKGCPPTETRTVTLTETTKTTTTVTTTTVTTTDTTTTDTTTTVTETSTVHFDCASDGAQTMVSWTVAKKHWCCLHKRIGCLSTTLATTTLETTIATTVSKTATEKTYRCEAPEDGWDRVEVDERVVCCMKKGLGCPSTTTTVEHYDCLAGFAKWQTVWTSAKKSWCCNKWARGCPELPTESTTVETQSTTPSMSSALRRSKSSTSAEKTTTVVGLVNPDKVLTCDLDCFGAAATHVVLPGSVGSGGGAFLADVSIDTCRAACAKNAECEGVLFTNKTLSGPFNSMCYGKKAIHASLCQPGGIFITEMIDSRPWGKCAIFGDPHILTWDRVYGPPITQTRPGEFYLVNSKTLQIHGRFGYTDRFKKASSTTGVAVGGDLVGGHTLIVEWVGPRHGPEGFRVIWDTSIILKEYHSKFESQDGMLEATYSPMNPTDFHREGRHTIGGTEGLLPSYYFQFKEGLNIYVLLGPDNCNVVIESRKLPHAQDGYCGNFNCDVRDDALDKIMMRKVADKVPLAKSLFRFGLPAPAWTLNDVAAKPSIQNCNPKVKANAEVECATFAFAMQHECIFDACAAALAADGADDRGTVSTHSLPFGCHFGGDGLWNDEESAWCCHHKGLGCSQHSSKFQRRDKITFKKLFTTDQADEEKSWTINFRLAGSRIGLVSCFVCVSTLLVAAFVWRHLRRPVFGARRVLVSNMDLSDILE